MLAMRQKDQFALAALCGSALCVSACATNATPSLAQTSGAPAREPEIASQTKEGDGETVEARAVRVASALAMAEAAYDANQWADLSNLVTALRAAGVKTREASQADQVAMWRKAAGTDTPPYRGRLLGPAYVRGELAPGQSWRSAQTFKSGEVSTLAVSHKGLGPVRMKVRDAKAREVCAPRKMNEPPCRFTPLFTQRYDIELTNEGNKRAVYYLVFD